MNKEMKAESFLAYYEKLFVQRNNKVPIYVAFHCNAFSATTKIWIWVIFKGQSKSQSKLLSQIWQQYVTWNGATTNILNGIDLGWGDLNLFY